LQDDIAYSVNPLSGDNGGDEDAIGDSLLVDSCARTAVYAPKWPKYFIVHLFQDYFLV